MISPRLIISAGFAIALPCCLSSCGILGAGLAAAGMVAETALALAPSKLAFQCLPEGAKIDTPNGPVPVELLKAGDFVIGYSGKPVQILQKQGYLEDKTSERFMTLAFDNGARVSLCDMHRIEGTHAMNFAVGDEAGGARLVSQEAFGSVERSYDLLTEDKGYRIGGIPVNSMILEMEQAARDFVEP